MSVSADRARRSALPSALRFVFAAALGVAIVPSREARAQATNVTPANPATPSDDSLAEYAAPLDPAACGIGGVIEDLAFVDLDERPGRLSDYADQRALVIVFREVGCPVSKLYGLRTAEIEQAYRMKDVAFLYVNPAAHDSVEDCRKERSQYGFTGRYARELSGRFGWHLKVRSTTDVFVLDGQRKLRYRGAIDDQIGRGATREKATREYLKVAIDAVLARRDVADPAMSAPGCALEFETVPPPEPSSPVVPFHGRVEAIVQSRCQSCHREGGVGPFELSTYEDVAGRRAQIRRAVSEHVMPPWFATADSGPFKNDLRLAPDERLDLLQWIQLGCAEGDPAAAPAPREWPRDWQIGEPDLVLSTVPVEIPATGIIDYLTVSVPTGLDRDVWVRAMQIRCEHPNICHHVLAQASRPDRKALDFLTSLVPGHDHIVYPEGQALLLRKGAELVLNLHYTADGERHRERTQVAFKFAKSKPTEQLTGKIVRTLKFEIPAGASDYSVISEWRFPYAATIHRLLPHMHLRGKSSKVEIMLPDRTTLVPLKIARFDPKWQFCYELVEPIEVERGTLVRVTSTFDNSAGNPFNPDARKIVREGPQINDEMAGCYFQWSRPLRPGNEPEDDK